MRLKVGVDQLRRLIRCNSVAACGLSFTDGQSLGRRFP